MNVSLNYLTVICLFFVMPINAFAAFKEGLHYELIKTELGSSKPQVREYFSYNCPHCYRLEPFVLQYLEHKKDDVDFKRVHVSFGRKDYALSQKAFVLEKLLVEERVLATMKQQTKALEKKEPVKKAHAKREKAITQKLFENIHLDNKPFKSEKDIYAFFEKQGYTKEQCKSVLGSFSAKMMLKSMEQDIRNKKITSVPAVIVNNRYKVKAESVKSKEEFQRLIEYLSYLK